MPDSEGEFGYLTTAQWRSFQWAVHYSLRLVPWLYAAGNYSINDPDEARSKSVDVPLGMPATMLAAIEIERLSRELGEWDNLEDIANDVFGAEIAKQFTREVQTAAHRWPFEDTPHKVEHLRCQTCSGETLRYSPPMFEGDDPEIGCTECGATLTEDQFRTLAAIVAEDMKKGATLGGAGRLDAA